MKNSSIIDDNNLLGYLISIKDDSNRVDLTTVARFMGPERSVETKVLLDILETKNYIVNRSFDHATLTKLGIKSYVSNQRKHWNKFKNFVSYIILYILGILSSVISQYIIDNFL